jgi:hypothetical protein
MSSSMSRIRKTRSEAQRACKGGKVDVKHVAKPHREVKPGDVIEITRQLGAASACAEGHHRPAVPKAEPGYVRRSHAAAVARGAGPARHDAGGCTAAPGRIPTPDRRGAVPAARKGGLRAGKVRPDAILSVRHDETAGICFRLPGRVATRAAPPGSRKGLSSGYPTRRR